jgi:hypothetical protein
MANAAYRAGMTALCQAYEALASFSAKRFGQPKES